jgi:hypothetical protein
MSEHTTSVPTLTERQTSNLVEEYVRVNAQYKDLEERRKNLSRQIQELQAKTVESASHKITVSPRKRDSLDRKGLEAEYGADEIGGRFVKTTEYSVLMVKEKIGGSPKGGSPRTK